MSRFNYFFREEPAVRAELQRLGITLVDVNAAGDAEEPWPALKLPSGKLLAIARDDEGNGPGAIHVFDPE